MHPVSGVSAVVLSLRFGLLPQSRGVVLATALAASPLGTSTMGATGIGINLD